MFRYPKRHCRAFGLIRVARARRLHAVRRDEFNHGSGQLPTRDSDTVQCLTAPFAVAGAMP